MKILLYKCLSFISMIQSFSNLVWEEGVDFTALVGQLVAVIGPVGAGLSVSLYEYFTIVYY